MDFKSLISKIESIDGPINTPKAPKQADPIRLDESTELRVLAGVTALTESMLNEKEAVSTAQQKAAGAALAAKRGDAPKSELKDASKAMMDMSIAKLEKMAGTKHEGLPEKKKTDESTEQIAEYEAKGGKYTHKGTYGSSYDGEDDEPKADAQKKPSKAAKTAAEKKPQKEMDKAEKAKSKDWEKRFGKGSVTRHTLADESIDVEAFKNKFDKMVEAAKPDANKDGIPDYAQDGKGANDLGKGKKSASKGETKDGEKGLSAKQKKLPPGLQKAIAQKKVKSEAIGDPEGHGQRAADRKQLAKDHKTLDALEKKALDKAKTAQLPAKKKVGEAKKEMKKDKKMVKESVEKLSLKDMLRMVKESGGQQAIDPVDTALWSWANRVAASKVQESQKAEIFAAMIYERNGGRFEMYDVLAEDQK